MTRLVLAAEVDPMPFKQPLRIAGHVFDGIPVVRVTLEGGHATGRGEASGVYYTGDDVGHILGELERFRPAIEDGIDRAGLRRLMPAGGARNAVDAALWEIESIRLGMPVWKLAGLGRPAPLITTFTLSADPPEQMLRHLGECAPARAIKLKLDGDLDADSERLRLVRRHRPDVWLMVDANQGYSVELLEKLLPVLVEARVALLEQPVARGSERDLEAVRSPIPIAADESLLALEDLEGLPGRFDVANIKLDKCGGLTEALMMVERARTLRLGVMVGNMAGSSLAAAPAWLVGQCCDYVDIDGPTFVARDVTPSVTYDDGHVSCPATLWGWSSKA